MPSGPGEQVSAASRISSAPRSASGPEKISLPAFSPWLAAERLLKEFQVLGFYLSAHPLDSYNSVLQKMRVQTFATSRRR
jgi:DNA polymerase III alpha subunit